ncbi:ZIP family metal transporter [Demequina sp.]|uniref:ZIP family metal transporter n=1 Tax=Demequina sp. TaxID=2050685 RepID=UPI003A857DED
MDLVTTAVAAALGIGTLLIGAGIAIRWDVPRRGVAGIMAFGAGVMVATLALELVVEARDAGGVMPVVVGFAGGAILYVAGDRLVARQSARHRSDSRNISARRGGDAEEGGGAFAVGALLDGIPEAIVIGLSVALSGQFPLAVVAAIGLSNIPEGLGGSVAMKRGGKSARSILGLWAGITATTVVAAVLGVVFLADAPQAVLAVVVSIAAGALLAMVCNAMIPEAFEDDHWATGLIATAGFLVAFVMNELT